MRKFTDIELEEVGHALGINIYHCRLSKIGKDKTLPLEFYRNYYNYGTIEDKCVCSGWVDDISEFIDKWEQGKLLYFRINEKGIDLFRLQFKEQITDTFIPLSRSKQRYQDFLYSDTGETFSEFLGIKRKIKTI